MSDADRVDDREREGESAGRSDTASSEASTTRERAGTSLSERLAERLPSRGSDGDRENPFTRRVNPLISNRPWTVVLVFLLVTGVFIAGAGMGGGEQEAGADQFADDTDEAEAFESIQDDFGHTGHDDGGATAQLFFEDERNVLSQPNLLRMLEFQDEVETRDGLRVESTTSPASLVAEQLDPEAQTPEEQYRAVERAPQRQLEDAIAEADEVAGLPVSTDFTQSSAQADVAQIAITYDTAPMSETNDHADLQFETVEIANDIEGFDTDENVVIFGDAIIEEETLQLLGDTSIVVFPAAMILILFFLLVAYRDPIDLGLGLVALLMTMIWTFGFMGFANIPFSDSLIVVFPLLLAVGIDFGIHIINRYREERATGTPIGESMSITASQLSTAFLIVTLTTVFSFAANLVSSMDGLRHFGIVAAAGMIFTFLIFGLFLPAGKVGFDRLREGTRFPQFGTTPLGRENSRLGAILPVGVRIARVAPAIFLVTMLIFGGAAAAYGTGVDTEFDEEAFFPEEERLEQYEHLPGPLAPGEYTFMTVLDYLEEDFDQGMESTITIYIDDGELRSDTALRDIERALENPPEEFETDGRQADAESILSVIERHAAEDPEFDAVVTRYDSNGDGTPDRDVDAVYDELFDSEASDEASQWLTTDRGATQIEITVDVDAEQDDAVLAAQQTADELPMDATATGQLVIFESVIDETTDASINSLAIAFLLTAIFLVLTYWWLEGRAIYGVLNLVPVLLTVAFLAGSMRYFDIPLSPINAPILSVSIGLGVDYTVHFMHRFVDEFEDRQDVHEALLVTVRGTGGALTGSMLTTVCGLGVLYAALIPLIMEFGLLLALGVFYACITSILVLPSVIVVWDRLESTDRLPTMASWR
ncbi:MMPL family transporter [Natronolimnohabitans sp. A-GB9]|uniref:efflux RND transporter permease subunit n=1 Tax=Natronolimnohabitans sp. A-GB9 TaxID=3069757 RepID=UPI0027B08B4D|nr:MMPL family transporter [Natronolimnohabitans sp. A-GB9]MDQ2049346.1 MMPL family transporter [Natronolimnohabitans sp. A-GB9]